MKSLKSYNRNVFQPAEHRLEKFYDFFSGVLTPVTPAPCLRACVWVHNASVYVNFI